MHLQTALRILLYTFCSKQVKSKIAALKEQTEAETQARHHRSPMSKRQVCHFVIRIKLFSCVKC